MYNVESVIKKYSQFRLEKSEINQNTFMPIYHIRHLTNETTYILELNGYIYDMESWIENWIKERIAEVRDNKIDRIID